MSIYSYYAGYQFRMMGISEFEEENDPNSIHEKKSCYGGLLFFAISNKAR